MGERWAYSKSLENTLHFVLQGHHFLKASCLALKCQKSNAYIHKSYSKKEPSKTGLTDHREESGIYSAIDILTCNMLYAIDTDQIGLDRREINNTWRRKELSRRKMEEKKIKLRAFRYEGTLEEVFTTIEEAREFAAEMSNRSPDTVYQPYHEKRGGTERRVIEDRRSGTDRRSGSERRSGQERRHRFHSVDTQSS